MTSSGNRFESRFRLTAILFCLLFPVLVCRALYIGWLGREKFIAAGEAMSKKTGKLPARRGELRDKNGIILAWNERHFELRSTLSSGEAFSPWQLDKLRSALPGRIIPAMPEADKPLCFQLTAKEIMALEPVVKSGFPVKIHSWSQRVTVNSPAARKVIGTVDSGTGVSGLEKQFDSFLRGTDGSYSVILDRRRNWIPSSFQVTSPPVHGRNVTLTVPLKQLESAGAAAR